MRVLVISQVVFSKTNNMGKTLSSYFRGFDNSEIAQLYLHAEIPTDDSICTRYYRFNDADALKSIFNRKIKGRIYSAADVNKKVVNTRTDTGIKRKAYILGSKHTPIVLILRDFIWSLSNWRNENLWNWLEDFKPEVILFASGDSGFTYKIVQYITCKYSIPFVSVCVDDYYLHNRNKGAFLANFQHKRFMKTVRACFNKTSTILTICDKMRDEYSLLFKKKCYTLYTAAVNQEIRLVPKTRRISYIGNVGYKRYEQLIAMGKALQQISEPNVPKEIDVYSGSISEEYISPLRSAPGICIKGEIRADDVLNVMENSIAVIHTESFDEKYKELTRYSISTKIAETLMYGPCLIAYGPKDIASIEYLHKNGAAYVITKQEDLVRGLSEILLNSELRRNILDKARQLAQQNHMPDSNTRKVRGWLQDAIEGL